MKITHAGSSRDEISPHIIVNVSTCILGSFFLYQDLFKLLKIFFDTLFQNAYSQNF